MILRFLIGVLLVEGVLAGGVATARYALDAQDTGRFWYALKQTEMERDMWRGKWEMYHTRRPQWDATKTVKYKTGEIPGLGGK